MAEGFLHQASENSKTSERSMEDIGEKYFDELWATSFFENVEADKWGNILRCKMHDLIHDLSISVSCKHQQDRSSNHTFKTHDRRRMSFFVDDEMHPNVEDFAREELRKLRSLHSNRVIFFTLSDFECLRSLNLYGANYEELPDTIGRLKHLRYLDISMNARIQKLPKSFTKLYNLQTLRVVDCHSLKELPSKIGILVSLRHIHFNHPPLVPFKVGSLTNLRTLPFFVVGNEVGYEIQELKHLNELRGKLEIRDLQHVGNGNEALAANLKGKKLSKLRLKWQGDVVSDNEREGTLNCSNRNHKEVLEALVPPESVMSLTIKGYMGKVFPEWICSNGVSESSLNQLAKLKLLGCENCEIVPTLGRLPSLKILEIEGLKNVRRIGSEFYGEREGNVKLFPVLEKLILWRMDRLEEWEAPDVTNHAISSLKELVIGFCSFLKSIPLSHLFSLKSISIRWCANIIALSREIKSCTSLKHLSIASCRGLISIETDIISSLTQLERLILGPFSYELVEFPGFDETHPANNPYLRELRLYGNGKIKSLPYLGHLTALEKLDIEYFEISELPIWLGKLSSLEYLSISNCKSLVSLPQSMQQLSKLKTLRFHNCYLLAGKFEEIRNVVSNNSHTPEIRVSYVC